MKYAFALVAGAAMAVAAPGWEKPEGYGAPAYAPETTSCSEEAPAYTPAPPQYETKTWESSSSWVESSSVWSESKPATWSKTWAESTSVWTEAPKPTTWYETKSKTWAESSSTWVESSSSYWKPEESSKTWVATTSVWTEAPKPTTWAATQSQGKPAPSGYAPKPSGGAQPSGYAPVGTVKPSGTGAWSAPSPTGSPITPYKGAAVQNAAGLLAGVGAVAALFL